MISLKSRLKGLSAFFALSLAACAPVNILNTLTPSSDFTIKKDISYSGLAEQKLDIYSPVTPKAGAPVIMFIYGGGWNSGTKDIYKFIGQAFTEAGYTTVIPTYRTYPEVIYPAFIQDTAKAVAWTHENLDRPIVMVGHSAGAHIAALLALDPKYLAAENIERCDVFTGWVGLAGPYDFKVFEEPYLSIFPQDLREREIQPITYAPNSILPALLLTGTDDETVEPAQTQRMETAFKAAGTPATAKLYEDTDHIAVMARISKLLRSKGESYADINSFIESLPRSANCAP